MYVVKANGERQLFDARKIQSHAKWACSGLEGVSVEQLEGNFNLMIYPDIPTEEIANGLIMAANTLISETTPNYTYVAARLLLQKIYKEATNGSIKYPHLKTYLERGIWQGQINPDMNDGRFDLNLLNAAITPSNDLNFTYIGMETLKDRYLLKVPAGYPFAGRTFELPQHMLMRVAMQLAMQEDDPTARAVEFYEVMSNALYLPSTPTLFNAGTLWPQLASCYGQAVPDDLRGIFRLAYEESGMLSKFAAGLGTSFSALRASGSPIASTNGESTGPIPFLKIYNAVALAVNQAGKRKGAFAPYLEVWHADIFDFIDLRMRTGDERLRCHDVFPAIWACDLFFERLEAKASWSLFCPRDVPELTELHGEDFRHAYEAAERKGLARRTVPAEQLWQTWMDRLYRTGSPWVTFKDECNRRNPQAHKGVIHNSNLCTEITLNNGPDETFVCNLGSINLARIPDAATLKRVITTAVRMLDNVIDLNYYPTENSARANQRHRPVGLGVMGYAEWLIANGIAWDGEEHILAADKLFERIAYHATEASMQLAKERGAYPTFEGSTWSQGKLTIDHARDQTCHVFSAEQWDALRQQVVNHGIRNSNILSVAPTATIANILGTTECIQPITERVTIKENLSGQFTIINPLAKYGRPDLIKTVWEVDMKWLIRAAAARQKWICQSQSLNLFKRADVKGREMSEWYTLARSLGVKTTYYLKVQKQTAATQQSAQEVTQATSQSDAEFVCEACQ